MILQEFVAIVFPNLSLNDFSLDHLWYWELQNHNFLNP